MGSPTVPNTFSESSFFPSSHSVPKAMSDLIAVGAV